MGKLEGKIALVTGASSGIGEATAQRLAMAGYKVYGTSRRRAQAGQRSFEMLPLDVTSDESVGAAVREVIRLDGRIDVLVNNAGFGVASAGAEESSIEQARSIFDTNFFGIVRMTRAVVPHMRHQGGGRIINIGSVLGFLPMPYGALYAATKHAIEGYSESLDHELRTRGIRASVIEPAYTKTQFDANFVEPDSKVDEYREARAVVNKRVKEVMATAEQPAGSRATCDCCADLRRQAWWTPGFERTCGSTRRRRRCLAPRSWKSSVLHGQMAFVAKISRRQALTAIAFSFGSIQGTHAAEYALGEGKLSVSGSVFLGTAIRTDGQDPALLSNVNSSLLGIDGTAIGGRNNDDGNLNFNRGDSVATVAKGYLTLGYTWRNYGALASAKAWYDYALADSGRPWGNVPSGYAAGEPLSDAGALPRSRFSGIVSDNLYGYGRNEVGSVPVDWKAGYQRLDWGNRYIAVGGLRDLTPVDVPAVMRPGALREEETRIAFPAAFVRLGVAPETSVEFFYQLHFQPNAPHECGAFFSQLDFASEGCDKILVGNISNRAALASGSFLKRADTIDPSNSGQTGIALKHAVDRWATEFGIYAAQFHSRSIFIGGVNSLRTGPPFIPNDPDNLNSKYFAEYPEDIRIFGLSFDTKMSRGAVFGELTYRPNQPYQYNGVDMINAFVSSTATTLLRAPVAALAPGATFHGYERHKALQLQLGATRGFPNALGSAELSTGAEIVYKRVPDLPDQSTARFGRSDIFGLGPVDGVCPPPATPTQCSSDGYVSRNAWGYRLRAGLRYANVFDGVDLIPSVAFGHDVAGWSGDQGIIEGRKLAIASLRANVAKRWTWEIAWLPTWGGTYNSLRDRSTAQTSIGYQF